MIDIVLESVRAVVLLGIVIYLANAGRGSSELAQKGWSFIVCGFILLLFGSLIDITDNFQNLNRFIVIGDTETQAFIEKVVGYLGGFFLVATGLLLWLPNIKQLSVEVLQRRQAEAAACESEELLKQVARMAQLGHWVWHDTDNRYIQCSEEAASLYGYSVDEFMERYSNLEHLTQDVHPDDREHYANAMVVVDSDDAYEVEVRERIRSGEYRYFREYGRRIYDESGRYIRTIGFNQDITRFKETEKALQKAKEEADSANRAKTQFLAKMSHEIRTPMNGVLGTTNLVLRTKLTDHQRRLIETAYRSAQNLLSLINDILDLSKIEAGKLEIDSREFDLEVIVTDICSLAAVTANDKRLDLSYFIDPKIPRQLWGDPDRLRQVLVNLVGNATKFTDRGEVSVRVECQGMVGDALVVSFEISDTGIGVTAEQMDRILKPFEQADKSTFGHYGGTGLGLAISQQLIEMMDGELSIESVEGQGSIFRFTLHLETSDRVSEPTRPDMEREPKPNLGATVLLAEDNPVNQLVAEEYLSSFGCNVDVVSNGLEALAAFERKAYDLILMDCDMPEMDGFEATKTLRQMKLDENRQQSTPIIALTALAFEGDRERCTAAGMDDFLGKPFDPKDLQAMLKRWLPALTEDLTADAVDYPSGSNATHQGNCKAVC